MSPAPRVAVIGAGIAGLSCARTLAAADLPVRVFEKSRGPGGRSATRRLRGLHFDHGAQYFTARDACFTAQVEDWLRRGVARAWDGQLVALDHGRVLAPEPRRLEARRYVGAPGMSALGRDLARDLDLRLGVRIASLQRSGECWQPCDEGGTPLGDFDAVLVAAPAPQSEALLQSVPALCARLREVRMAPCQAALVAFEKPPRLAEEVRFGGAFVNDSPLAWIARGASKPDRPDAECWTLHATPEWSLAELETAPERVVQELLGALEAALGEPLPEPVHRSAHRWRYALPTRPLEERSLYDAQTRTGACGDWCGGARLEAAFLSGRDLAQRALADLATG